MQLMHGLHLAYCTNIHRGETWAETFDALERHTLAVRERVCPHRPYAIGLRLSDRASRELSERATLAGFHRWLDQHQCHLCSHLEMETYTWEAMPPSMKNRSVVEQLTAEYAWTLQRLAERGIHPV